MARTGKTTSSPSAERVRALLLEWFREAARDLPWRRTRDPYAIWVSEVMLQQTRVATVIPYFDRWMQRFPTLEALGRADEDDVLHAWQGLGYYARARSLRAGAQAVVERHAGKMPTALDELVALPGIGPYTAGAIASIAFDQPAAIVDGNVVRVVTRLYALRGDPARAPLKQKIWKLAEELVPEIGARNFNQALMELGATVCTPKAPACGACPLEKLCGARKRGWEERLPELAKKKKPTAVQMVAAVVERRGRVLVTRVPDDAPRWAGMWQFPNTEQRAKEPAASAVARALSRLGLKARAEERLLVVRHSVTRYRIELSVHRAKVTGSADATSSAWKRIHELSELALPSAHRRIARALSR
jgi:A/G-specific adenine glycosylase